MKIQGLAIIFILLILPITIAMGEYAYTQREISRLENLYDSRLITATYDGLKAFQINTFNDATSDIVDSKINTIEASVNAFYNSMETSFGLEGYSREDLKRYVPAVVFTMYDGYYIYSPYTNVTSIRETGDEYDPYELYINLDSEDIEYGFKPYVYYSCRYVKDDIDVIINYAMDNYITVQGTIGSNYYYKSGYLVTIADSQGDEGVYKQDYSEETKYYYSGIEITAESNLTDWIVESDGTLKEYKYIKLNGNKYYWDEEEEYIFHLRAGERITQATKNMVEYAGYVDEIQNNRSGIKYYESAYEFTTWVNSELGSLKPSDAVTEVANSGNGYIFENEKIEYSSSNFNLHRKEVIRHAIETNLSIAIANFNNYTDAGTNFQMPVLSETDWEMLENEISIISFMQGLNIGGKIYNGYTVVTNGKTEEVVKEERIFITADENGDDIIDYYHKINDKHLVEDFSAELAEEDIRLGVFDLDYEIRKNNATGVYYMQKKALGCYTSIVGQENLDNTYDSVYEYLQNLDHSDAVIKKVKQTYYIALGRERWGSYKVENPTDITEAITVPEPEPDPDPDPVPDANPEPDPEITPSPISPINPGTGEDPTLCTPTYCAGGGEYNCHECGGDGKIPGEPDTCSRCNGTGRGSGTPYCRGCGATGAFSTFGCMNCGAHVRNCSVLL